VKIATGGFSANLAQGLPTGNGVMVVFSKMTGMMSGVLLDEGWLTDLRTAAAGSVVARHMAPKKITSIGVIGTGI